ncbi:MAG TPA: cobalamin-binding protein [Ktedonobacteraceae bacterium]|nr:cobalamin-binding protein [Ktedonobacteraceae bacterium]
MRIVSLLASATEMVAELGCLDQLVGRSHECDYPPEILHLPVVSTVQINVDTSSEQIDAQIKQLAQAKKQDGALKALSIYAINTELLQILRPDIIFTQTQCEVCAVSEQDVAHALQQLTGFQPRIVSLAPYTLSDVWDDVLRVGKALERNDEARQLIQGYQRRMERLASLTTSLSQGSSKPRVAVLEWLDPLMAAGNWTPELVTYAGGEAVFGETGTHSPWISWEELHTANPDVLVLAPCGFSLERTMVDVALLQQQPMWQALQAVRNGRVYAIDGNHYLNRSGPRLVESTELLARVLWGERLGIEVDAQGWQHIA